MSILYTLGIISDIHSNFEALKTVITDMKDNFPEIKEIYCLGDIVGYGPDPLGCLDFIFEKENLITKITKGNHEDYVVRHFTPPQINTIAKIAIDFQIDSIPLESRALLTHLPHTINTKHVTNDAEILLVHGSPQYPITEYIYPDTDKQEDLFTYMKNNRIDILLLGHTHIPFIRKLNLDNNNCDLLIVNPGAVGQPRDGDPRASYAMIDIEKREAVIRRISYDIPSVQRKIEELRLPSLLGSRLLEGK